MKNNIIGGRSLPKASKVLIMVHGRGGTAEEILSLSTKLDVGDFALIAPQAEGNTWYPNSFLSKREQNEPYLSSSLDRLKNIVEGLYTQGFTSSDIFLLGFSQGACLVLEFAASKAVRFGGVIAFTGGVIGEHLDHRNYHGDFDGTPVFIGSSNPDFHVPVERVNQTTELYEGMGARVTEIIYENMGHIISQAEITQVNKLIFKKSI